MKQKEKKYQKNRKILFPVKKQPLLYFKRVTVVGLLELFKTFRKSVYTLTTKEGVKYYLKVDINSKRRLKLYEWEVIQITGLLDLSSNTIQVKSVVPSNPPEGKWENDHRYFDCDFELGSMIDRLRGGSLLTPEVA